MLARQKNRSVSGAGILAAATLGLFVAQSSCAEGAGSALTIDQALRRAIELKGQRILVRGYIVIEPEDKNLWTGAGAYGEAEEPCISLDITDALFNRRELYNHREADVSGIVSSSACGGETCIGGCSDSGLTNIAVVRLGKPPLPQALLARADRQSSMLLNQHAPDANALRSLGERIARVTRAGYLHASRRTELLALSPKRYRSILSAALKEKDSRPNWLLFDWDNSLGRQLARHGDVHVDIAQTELSGANRKNFICYCVVAGLCDPTSLTAQRVYFRAGSDPYFCIPAQKSRGEWVVDVGFLVGRPAEEHMN